MNKIWIIIGRSITWFRLNSSTSITIFSSQSHKVLRFMFGTNFSFSSIKIDFTIEDMPVAPSACPILLLTGPILRGFVLFAQKNSSSDATSFLSPTCVEVVWASRKSILDGSIDVFVDAFVQLFLSFNWWNHRSSFLKASLFVYNSNFHINSFLNKCHTTSFSFDVARRIFVEWLRNSILPKHQL